jgi:hypothetical protein
LKTLSNSFVVDRSVHPAVGKHESVFSKAWSEVLVEVQKVTERDAVPIIERL